MLIQNHHCSGLYLRSVGNVEFLGTVGGICEDDITIHRHRASDCLITIYIHGAIEPACIARLTLASHGVTADARSVDPIPTGRVYADHAAHTAVTSGSLDAIIRGALAYDASTRLTSAPDTPVRGTLTHDTDTAVRGSLDADAGP